MEKISLIGGHLYQWDTGRKIKVCPCKDVSVDEVHFSNMRDTVALRVDPVEEDGEYIASIPNILLQKPKSLNVYIVMVSEDGERTTCSKTFSVRPRERPEDYVYTETEHFHFNTKLNKNLGEANAGKILIVGDDGNIYPVKLEDIGGSGGSGIVDGDIATDDEVNDMLDDIFNNGTSGEQPDDGSGDITDEIPEDNIATDDEVNDMLDDIFG